MRPLKRSFMIAGHATSLSLEAPFWAALKEVAHSRGLSVAALVAEIDRKRGDTGLSSAARICILAHFRGEGSERTAARPAQEPEGRGH